MVYQDGSEYRGGLINGVKNGYGHYIWPQINENDSEEVQLKSGHTYIGSWKEGAMHGAGKF